MVEFGNWYLICAIIIHIGLYILALHLVFEVGRDISLLEKLSVLGYWTWSVIIVQIITALLACVPLLVKWVYCYITQIPYIETYTPLMDYQILTIYTCFACGVGILYSVRTLYWNREYRSTRVLDTLFMSLTLVVHLWCVFYGIPIWFWKN